MKQQTSFDFNSFKWQSSWPQSIAQYNLVYRTPPSDPLQGLPLGNGRLGALLWFEDDAVVWQLNRCDLFDEVDYDTFSNWERSEEEKVSTLRHAGRGRLKFQLPVFDRFYLRDCRGVLDIASGKAVMEVESFYGRVKIEAVIDDGSDNLLLRVKAELSETVAPELVLERYGSRTYSHWYSLINRDPSFGQIPTEALITDDGNLGLRMKMSNREFAYAASLDCNTVTRKVNSCEVIARMADSNQHSFRAIIGATGLVHADSFKELLEIQRKLNWTTAVERTAAAWKKFWQNFRLRSANDYLNNLYYLSLYFFNASQRGKYPGRFINGLWNWNRDVQPWNFFFHWNQQQLYWGVYAAGHPELAEAYLDFRFRNMDKGLKDAEEYFKVKSGLFVSDVVDCNGVNSAAERHNHTPSAQIAMDFYRYYQYTLDHDFLREKAYPYMRAAAIFLAANFSGPGADGRYHSLQGTVYEGWVEVTDSVTEISCLQALLGALLEVADELDEELPEAAHYRDMLAALPDYPLAPGGAFIDAEGKYTAGNFVGQQALGEKLLASGFRKGAAEPDISFRFGSDQPLSPNVEDVLHAVRGDMRIICKDNLLFNEGIFPWAEHCPVFPSGVLGLAQKGSPEYDAAVNTALITSTCMFGMYTTPIVLARLGLAEELKFELEEYPEYTQWFANGFMHYGSLSIMLPETFVHEVRHTVKDAASDGSVKFPFEQWPFRHCGFEPQGTLLTAMNESMLQSYDGTIRVFPAYAYPKGSFTLHAVGGSIVSAELENGKVLFIAIFNKFKRQVKVHNPWNSAADFYTASGTLIGTSSEDVFELDFTDYLEVIIIPAPLKWDDFVVVQENTQTNQTPKKSAKGRAMLGMDRLF